MQQVIDDANNLISSLDEAYFDFAEYQLLRRVIAEQTQKDSDGKIVPKCKKQISTSSLQNPSDPDDTYRRKAGKYHKRYVGNLVEAFDENGAIITSYDYQTNTHSDSSFCKKTIEKLELQETTITLLADGAYASTENIELAAKNNIELITTALIGKSPDVVQASFEIDPQNREVTKRPAGHKPYKTRYYEATEMYRASFNKSTCISCPLKDQCGVKFQKKSSFVMVSEKTVQRASYLLKLSTKEYTSLAKKRNGVEGIPSVLRRKYNVDNIPTKGLVRSKIWFSFKIAAINVKRVLKKTLENALSFQKKHLWCKNLRFLFYITKNLHIEGVTSTLEKAILTS